MLSAFGPAGWLFKATAVRAIAWPLTMAGWTVTLPLAVIAAGRVFAHDQNLLFAVLNAYTFWLYVPAYAALAVALVFKRWLLFIAAVAVVAGHVSWVAPDYGGARELPAEVQAAPRFRLMTANIRINNDEVAAIMAEVVREDPDVLFVQEFTTEAEAALREAGIDGLMPYHVGEAIRGDQVTTIYSKQPLERAEAWDAGGVEMTRATIEVEGRALRLYNVHPGSPTGFSNFGRWRGQLRAVLDAVRAEEGPLVVAGDFNTTQHHQAYGEFLDLGFRDAHRDRGKGNATTWPNGRGPLPAIRIDQVFLRDGVECLAIREGSGKGSDHRPVIADLAIIR